METDNKLVIKRWFNDNLYMCHEWPAETMRTTVAHDPSLSGRSGKTWPEGVASSYRSRWENTIGTHVLKHILDYYLIYMTISIPLRSIHFIRGYKTVNKLFSLSNIWSRKKTNTFLWLGRYLKRICYINNKCWIFQLSNIFPAC